MLQDLKWHDHDSLNMLKNEFHNTGKTDLEFENLSF